MNLLQDLYNNIMAFFSSTYMYILATVGLCIVAMKLYSARHSADFKTKLIEWVLIIIVLSSLGLIIEGLFGVKETVSKYYFFDFDTSSLKK